MQERRNSIANALELRLSCTNPSLWCHTSWSTLVQVMACHLFGSKLQPELVRTYCQSDLNPLRSRQNGRHFADDTLNRIFLNENVIISIKISLKFAPKGSINNIPALVQIMAWRRPGDKPLSEPMLLSLLTHICVTLPQRVKGQSCSEF